MSLIHILDEATINQIAAGEVVERPSAVVKELIENAMDAGATAITAEIKEGGLTFIRITDNGSGMDREDIPLAFLRHATSKIRTAGDLLSVTSLGFRGEALSSIASVAQVELITKTPTALNGFRYVIEGGEEKSVEEIGCPGGTTIIVRNLFFNTPARRKFLKSAVTEAGYVSDLMERLMISHPNVSFKFITNNQVKLQSSGNNNSKDILYQIYGRDITRELLSVEYEAEGIKVTGYIGKPSITRGNRNFENYFINGRYIKSNIITKAIEEGYKSYLMQHKYPFTSLYFEIDPEQIDVNVHPQKLEIRLKNGEEIYRCVYGLIRDALSGKEMIPKVTLVPEEEKKQEQPRMPEPFEQKRREQYRLQNKIENEINNIKGEAGPEVSSKNHSESSEPVIYELSAKVPLLKESSGRAAAESKGSHGLPAAKAVNPQASLEALRILSGGQQMDLFTGTAPEEEKPFLSNQAVQEHRIIGQVFSTYWLVEYKKDLYIIDQHAAHEKVLYERIMAAAKTKTYVSQQLLPPIVLTLTLREQEVLAKREEVLTSIGYEFEHFGGNEYSVRAVPADLYGLSEKELLLEFIDDLAEEVNSAAPAANSILERVASMSCKAAVKANHTFSHEEAGALIRELLTLENPYHCPHGRPVIISMSQYELERKFKRVL
ncbi:DNA mismatch repair protein MutL [Anaerotaenia torta]|uniref:DNA mismatch repair endonuclease MutL n=1 Tax=Anaerotaenia torta TaxID=433293 RepID=UPI003D1C383B